ncbi:MAG: ABC transporter substrate-binding protein [Smithella sp.]|jgi:branched-chain amino acid transport system substrate-binding protein
MKKWKWFLCSMFVFSFIAWAAVASAEEIVIGYTGPLSGPGAEYGQDCANGVDMAVKELNAAGGVTIQGKKYTYNLVKLDDRSDPTLAKNNALRLVNQNKAIAVFNPMITTTASIMGIPQHNFLIMAYTSIHTIMDKGHPMIVTAVPNFVTYAQLMADQAWAKGYRNCAMVVTMGGYGDAWRKIFSLHWAGKGGRVVGDFPANYYTETDFSTQLAAALAKKPDFLLIGGPSAPTVLVIEQARAMGFKGGFVVIDQAKPDYIAKVIKNMNMLEGMISTGALKDLPLPAVPAFAAKYKAAYKRDMNAECVLNYNMMKVLARSINISQSLDAKVVRYNMPKALPTLGDTVPNELFAMNDNGFMYCGLIMQQVKNGKFTKVDYILAFPKTQAEFMRYKKMSKSAEPEMIRWVPIN